MFLKKITLTNFRQFYGKQELLVAGDKECNVTLIHAENGVGKTTILNAILWCFYNDTTARFEQPEKIANHQAISEGNYSVKVEVIFENEEEEFLVSREINEHSSEEYFKAFKVNKGNYVPLDAPSAFVDSVVPREMARYFFFDGEYAETFSSQNNKSKVRVALEDMLGCRTANQAIDDLRALQSNIEKQVAALTKNNLAESFQKNITDLENQNTKDKAALVLHEENLDAAKNARKEISDKLRGTEGVSDIQKKREQHEKEKEEIVEVKKKYEKELTLWIYDGGLSLISKHLEEKTQEMLDDAKVKGKIPSYMTETFVQGVLEKQVCICERAFEEPSNEANAIRSLLKDAGNAIAADRLMEAKSLMGALSAKRQKALTDLSRIKGEISACVTKIGNLEAKIEDCRIQLKDSKIEEVAEREEALEKRNQEIEDLNREIGKMKSSIKEHDKRIEENTIKRDKHLPKTSQTSILQARCALLTKTIERISIELEKYREDSRNAIVADVNDILEKTARRNYYATIDEKFNLDMHYKETDTPVARSSGENQLLSLAFIAALLKFSADRMKSDSELLKPGTSAPLVLDSPFGQLDPTYQKATAKFLPLMARQVILLLSKTQGNDEVMEILSNKIGQEYVLVSENIAQQEGKPADNIVIKGKKTPSSLYGCEKTLTRIVRV